MMMDLVSNRMLPPTKIKRQVSLTVCTEQESCQCGRCKRKKFAARKYEPNIHRVYDVLHGSSSLSDKITTPSQNQFIQNEE
jgi:hypothetical protein